MASATRSGSWRSPAARSRSRIRPSLFSGGRLHQARPRTLLRRGRRGRSAASAPARSSSSVTSTAPTSRRSTRSARRRAARRGSRRRRCAFLRPHGRRVVVRDLAALVWIVNLGCIDLHPHPVRVDDLDHPDELRVDLDPYPASAGTTCGGRPSLPRRPGEHGLTAWPKTSVARHAPLRPHRAAADSTTSGVPRWRSRARSSAAPRPRDQRLVEGGARGRLHRLQPERQGPHDGVGLLGAPDTRRARLDAAFLGRGARLRPGGVHARDGPGALREIGDPGPASTTPRGRSTRCWHSRPARPRTGSATRRGRRTTRRRGRAAAGRAEPAGGRTVTDGEIERSGEVHDERRRRDVRDERRKDRAAGEAHARSGEGRARHDRLRQAPRGRARRPRALEGAPPRGRRALGSVGRARRHHARPLEHLDARADQPPRRPRCGSPAGGAARPGLRPALGVAKILASSYGARSSS